MKHRYWFILIVLLIFSLSCSAAGGGADEEGDTGAPAVEKTEEKAPATNTPRPTNTPIPTNTPAPTNTPKPTDTPEPTDTPVPEDVEFPEIDPGGLLALDSYRSTTRIYAKMSDGQEGEMLVEQESTQVGPAQRLVMSVQGADIFDMDAEEMGEDFEIEIIHIEETLWMRFGEVWMQTSADGQDPIAEFSESFEIDDIYSEMGEEDVEFVGSEEVTGINTKHFRIESDDASQNLFDMGGSEEFDIDKGVVDVWIADDPDLPEFPVRLSVDMTGETTQLTLEVDVYEINEPVLIEPPEDMGESGLPKDVPEYPNAEDVNVLGGLIVFYTNDDVTTVAEFYRENLEKEGWTQVESTEMGVVMETWEKDDRTLELMVTENEEDANTGVMITITTGEEE